MLNCIISIVYCSKFATHLNTDKDTVALKKLIIKICENGSFSKR